ALDGDGNRRKSLVDLDAFNVTNPPSRARERLLHRRDRAESEHAGLHRGDAVGYKTRHRREAVLPGPVRTGDDHRRRAAIEARRIAGGDRAVLAESRPQLGEARERSIGAVVLVFAKESRLVPFAQLDRY